MRMMPWPPKPENLISMMHRADVGDELVADRLPETGFHRVVECRLLFLHEFADDEPALVFDVDFARVDAVVDFGFVAVVAEQVEAGAEPVATRVHGRAGRDDFDEAEAAVVQGLDQGVGEFAAVVSFAPSGVVGPNWPPVIA
jgi:hypothetical protein